MPNGSKPVMFGHPPGVQEGDLFAKHTDLYQAGVHRFSGQGISGTEATGVDSIVLSGGYIDDRDNGDEIIYTGMGSRDRSSGNLVADQSMEEPGNAGLVVSQALGKSVRVIEGLGITGGKRRRPSKGYRYRGLYRVAEHWMTVGQEGFRICQFRLIKLLPGESPAPQRLAPEVSGDTELERQARRYLYQQRLVRDTKVVRRVKQLHADTCQMCRTRMVVSPAGEAYSEGAHIKALGKPYHGPDVLGNILCLCPSCHVRFDRGVLQITDDYEVLDGLEFKVIGMLERVPEHHIEIEFIQHHRNRWAARLR